MNKRKVCLIMIIISMILIIVSCRILKNNASEGSNNIEKSMNNVTGCFVIDEEGNTNLNHYRSYEKRNHSGAEIRSLYKNIIGSNVKMALIIDNINIGNLDINLDDLKFIDDSYYICSAFGERKINTEDISKIVLTNYYKGFIVRDRCGTIVGLFFKIIKDS